MNRSPGLKSLLGLCKEACEILTPFIREVYEFNKTNLKTISTLKADKTAFTIADGIVQHLILNTLFDGNKVAKHNLFKIVAEEDSFVQISKYPYEVDGIKVPESISKILERTKKDMLQLRHKVDNKIKEDLVTKELSEMNLTVFVDPIDGTKSFVNGIGSHCCIMIGFASEAAKNKAIAGVIFRPLTEPPSYAMGISFHGHDWAAGDPEDEDKSPISWFESRLDDSVIVDLADKECIVLKSETSRSVFLQKLKDPLRAAQIVESGSGNKIMLLMELAEKYSCPVYYVQDRGVSRWDTCAGEAVIRAYGGCFMKLTSFMKLDPSDFQPQFEDIEEANNTEFNHVHISYTYKRVNSKASLIEEDIDLDFSPTFSRSNIKDAKAYDKLTEDEKIVTPENMKNLKAYSNVSGFIAISNCNNDVILKGLQAVKSVAQENTPELS